MADDNDYGEQPEATEKPAAKKPAAKYDENSPNLAIDFSKTDEGKKFLKKLSEKCMENYQEAYDSSEEYRHRAADDWKIFLGDLPKKQPPFEKSPNPHVPIMLTNLARIYSRSATEIFGDWSNVVTIAPVGSNDYDAARIRTLHTNWQLREQITNFKREMYRALLMFFTCGDVAAHSYWDPFRRRNTHEVLSTDNFIIPYVYVTTEPDYSDVPFKCKIMRRYRHELQRYRDVWLDVDKVIARTAPSWGDDPETPLREETGHTQGQEMPDGVKGAPYVLIWYEGWCELPGDDIERYVKVVIDKTTHAVMHLQVHEKEDWKDKLRFTRQTAELDAYTEAMQGYAANIAAIEQQKMLVQERLMAPDVDPQEAAVMQAALAEAPLPPMPPAPEWTEPGDDGMPTRLEPEPVRMVPIEMFSHGVCIEPLVGSLGLSYGRIEADLNRAANVSLSQFADSAALNNANVFFTNNVEFDTPPSFYPGANIKTRTSTTKLSDSIMPMSVGPASPQLMQLVELMSQFGSEVLQAPGVLSGESGKSGETFRGIAARIEQATKQLSFSTRKFGDFIEQIGKHNCELNAVYLDDEEVFQVNDHALQTIEEMRTGRRMYQHDFKVEVRSDLRFATQQQRIAEADEALNLASVVPPLMNDLAYWHAAVTKCLQARELHDMVPLLGPPPPPPMTPFGIMPTMPGAPVPGEDPAAEQQQPPGQHPEPVNARGGQAGQPPPQAPGPDIQRVSDHGGPQSPQAPGAPS